MVMDIDPQLRTIVFSVSYETQHTSPQVSTTTSFTSAKAMLPISIRPPPSERKEILKTQELDGKPYSSSTFCESQDHPHPPSTFPSATSKTSLSQPLLLLPLFEAALLTNATTILILAVVYAHQLLHAQAQPESDYSSANRAQTQTQNNALHWTLVSTAVTPVLSIFAALTGHIVWYRQRRRRKGVSAACSAIVTASFLVGWLVNVASWAVCDWEPSSSGECELCVPALILVFDTGYGGKRR